MLPIRKIFHLSPVCCNSEINAKTVTKLVRGAVPLNYEHELYTMQKKNEVAT